MNKKVICFGEVLWDKLPDGPRIGGAPLNVCYHLNQQGIQTYIISQVGDDDFGKAILSQINAWGIDATFCQTTNEYPTSVVEVGLDGEGKATYTIVEQVAWDYIYFNPLAAEAIKQSDAFIFGSLAARNKTSLHTLKRYLQHSPYSVMDINLRSPYYQAEVIFELLQWTDCLKINDEEVVLLAQWLRLINSEMHICISKVFEKFPRLKSVILTKGGHGAEFYSRKEHISVTAYVIDVKDTVGAGDAFLATFIAEQLQHNSTEVSLESASLVSAFVATKAGACPSYMLNDLENFKLLNVKYENL